MWNFLRCRRDKIRRSLDATTAGSSCCLLPVGWGTLLDVEGIGVHRVNDKWKRDVMLAEAVARLVM